MCGIVGIMHGNSTVFNTSRDRENIARALKRMAHRGPDAEGICSIGKGRILFGHRRLSIIDLSPKANQPMRLP